MTIIDRIGTVLPLILAASCTTPKQAEPLAASHYVEPKIKARPMLLKYFATITQCQP